MTAANFDVWWQFCQRPENDGREDDTPPGSSDPPTRWGFTYPTWSMARRYCGYRLVTMTQFVRQTRDDMRALARMFFWDRQFANDMSAGNDISVIDWTWTSGGAVYDIQEHLGLRDSRSCDGLIGPVTLGRIESFGPELPNDLCAWRKAYYDDHGFRQKYPGLYRRADQALDLSLRSRAIA